MSDTATEQHYRTFRSARWWNAFALNRQAAAAEGVWRTHYFKKVWRKQHDVSCKHKSITRKLLSLGLKGRLCNPTDSQTDTHRQTEACLYDGDISVYLCLVNRTMKTVVLLIKEQAELQCSQVGWKQHKPLQLLPVKGHTQTHTHTV